MNKTKLIAATLVACASLQTAMATETVNSEIGELMHVDGELCPTAPLCPPPVQQLESEEDDNG